MHKSATKCNETVGKWCKNKHGASKIIDMLETYHGAPSGMDACKLAAIDHSQLYLIALQVDPYTAVLDDGQEFAVQNDHMEIMVDPNTVIVDQILEQLKQRCPWGPNQQARLRWWHFKKRDFIEIVKK
jgi:hypothetical protein